MPASKRPPYKRRRAMVGTRITPSEREYLDDASRRLGKSLCELLGDLIEHVIEEKMLDALANRTKAKH